jgi:Cleaved Adhesin Domain.
LSEVAYVPWSNAPTYYVSVWTGGNDSAAGTLEVERTVSGQGLNAKEWNTIALNTPLIIDATKELRIGIRINYAGGEVVGCDNATAPEADGKSNLIMKSNVWQKLTDVDPAYTYNLCIGGNIIDAEGRSINLNRASRGGNVTEYSVYRDGELLTTTTSTSYSETGLVEDIYTYCVTASYDNGCVSEEVCEDFFAGNPCPAVENVTATTTSEWPACEVEITWDAADPMYSPEVVFYESFNSGVPSTWSNLDKDGDERKWRSSMEEDGWYTYSPPIALEGYCIASEHTYLDDEGYYQTAFADNWMVTPAIKLTHGSAVLNYWVAQLYGYPTDTYYEVLVSTTGTDYDDFTRIYSEYMPSTGYTIIWNEKNIDLSAYTGDVYVAFRHYNVGEYESAVGIQLDEVKVIEQTPSDRLYNVYRDETLIAANVLATSFVDDDFESGTHEWSVTAICNEFGHESNPASATVSCDQGESINEPNSEKMMIYPNPTTGKVTVESNSETIKCIYILDVAGKVIDGLDNINRNKTEIDLTGLSKGIYFLKINEQIDKVIKK